MAFIPLGGSEETHIIFAGDLPDHIADLEASEQRDLLKKLNDITEQDAPPDSYVHEKIGNLDIIKFSEVGRAYTKVITYIPDGNTQYHVIYVLYVDENHEYDQGELGKFSHQAQQKLATITSLDSLEDVQTYLADHNSLTSDDIDDLLND